MGHLLDGRYRLEGFLGEGGTATVHLARDLDTLQLVVVKRMKADVAGVDQLRRSFVLEAKALKAVSHEKVVRALDVAEPRDGRPYLVLEALHGETLGERLARTGALSVESALDVVEQAAEALLAVHDAGIVHRDIKPDNLFLVGEPGQFQQVKVLDFGMAHFRELSRDPGEDEADSSILGTVQYMAPEQILIEDLDARTDAYALGVVLFRLLTGHLPFDARSKKDLLRHQLFSPVPPVSWLVENLPEPVVELVRVLTQKNPDRRPGSMSEVLEALAAIRAGSFAGNQQPSSWDFESDVYEPRTDRGRDAATLLAREFGIYSRPHSPRPPRANER